MKNIYGFLAVILSLSLLLMPLLAVRADLTQNDKNVVPTIGSISPTDTLKESFKVRLADGSIKELSAVDYVLGVVAAEMPASYRDEALKAQAVAAYTFALYKSAQNTDKDYDITADFTVDQSFIDEAGMAEKWGEQYDQNRQKILAAVESVKGLAIKKEGKPILSVYTAISSGRTESAENVWGSKIDYLVPKDSIGDLLCPDYLSEAAFTLEQINSLLITPKGITAPSEEWFINPVLSDSGSVKSISFGSSTLSGNEVRQALSLRSADFSVIKNDTGYSFTVRGYGHLVGMSQYGANYMAMQGSGYKEILEWYYTGCTVG